jgi:deoxyribonuclease IV
MLGSHLSIAGGMVNALLEARKLKMDCVQVFTKNQRQWSAKPLAIAERTAWLDQLQSMQWDSHLTGCAGRVVSHNSYLINMAQPDSTLWRKSVAAQRIELERCETLHIPFCVSHPGAHLGPDVRRPGSPNDLNGNPTKHEVAGLKRISNALNQLHDDLPGYCVLTLLETTVGSGSNLGYSFRQLAMIRQSLKQPERVGFCFDTCHVTAAGYDMSRTDLAEGVLQHFDDICGIRNLRAFHLNDSVGALGSRRDRHAHIGKGLCGRCCFQVILNNPAFQTVPKILETPKGLNDKGVAWDLINLRRLKRMTVKPALSR